MIQLQRLFPAIFSLQQSSAHSFEHLVKVDRDRHQLWREAANPSSKKHGTVLVSWQRMCDKDGNIRSAWQLSPGHFYDCGMHRTDTIDIAVIIDGETNVGYPGDDGRLNELTVKTGDVVVNNGTFHSWHNRSTKNCSILFVVFAAERKAS